MKIRIRNRQGSQLAELPAAIMLLLTGIAIPLMIMASVFYKVYMFECVVKNSAIRGATQTDLAAATTTATNYCTTTRAGVTVNPPTCSIVERTVNYTTSAGNKTYKAYFLQVSATGSVPPLVQMGSYFGMLIPGLTGPMTISSTQAVYFENQQAVATP